MKQRQKFWSHSTGFKFGRKLADWGQDGSGKHGPDDSADADISPEDKQIQRAIALSLEDLGGVLLFYCAEQAFTVLGDHFAMLRELLPC